MEQRPKSYLPHPALDHAAAGVGAGLVTTLTLHPLDVIKTRMQVVSAGGSGEGGYFGQTVRVAKNIALKESYRGFYNGLSANLAGSASSWGLYFLFYSLLKARLLGANPASQGEAMQKLSIGQHLLAATEAGLITVLITNPFWVVKTRMCIQDAASPTAYRGLFDALKRIWIQEGLAGWYKGMTPALFGVSHGAIQFMVYEQLKQYRAQVRLAEGSSLEDAQTLNPLEYVAIAASSKSVATITTYPYQVVRSRLQDHRKIVTYTGAWDVISKTFQQDGMRGFFRGLTTNLFRVIPGTCITFSIYEALSGHFKQNSRIWFAEDCVESSKDQ